MTLNQILNRTWYVSQKVVRRIFQNYSSDFSATADVAEEIAKTSSRMFHVMAVTTGVMPFLRAFSNINLTEMWRSVIVFAAVSCALVSGRCLDSWETGSIRCDGKPANDFDKVREKARYHLLT